MSPAPLPGVSISCEKKEVLNLITIAVMMPVKYGTACDIESYCIKKDELFGFVPASAAAAGVGFK